MRFWSFSTTVRNPDRIRNFLKVLKELEGYEWNTDTQSLFQIHLIHKKIYGYGSQQFYKGLTNQQIENLESSNFTFEQAQEIFNSKSYNDPPMRGRQSYNPIAKLGFVMLEEVKNKKKIIRITELGKKFIEESFSLKEIFLKSLLKWQYPNPDDSKYKYEQGYDIKPFIATLRLIYLVNKICVEKNIKSKGVSRTEFALFFVSLINYKDMEKTAKKLVDFRIQSDKIKNKKEKQDFTITYFNENYGDFESWNNANEYTDNIIRDRKSVV
jgi:predicted transcriptional regulator